MTVPRLFRWLSGLAALTGLGVLLYFATLPPPLVVQGEVSADRIDMSPRVSGKVVALGVKVGDTVERGALLAKLESPQLASAVLTARAALAVARADLARISSTRPETIAARQAELAATQADVVLFQETYDRQAQLVRNGNTAQARLDEVTRNLEASLRKRESAEAALKLAVAGASAEERALAASQVAQAEAVLEQRLADVGELTITAPIRAEVTTKVAEIGENFSAGAPIVSLIDMSNLWVTFNLREDLLMGLKVGDPLVVSIPALGARDVAVRVTVINVQGQFATWRATRATGDFDLRTFEVRAVPEKLLEGLRPGMSVVAHWAARNG